MCNLDLHKRWSLTAGMDCLCLIICFVFKWDYIITHVFKYSVTCNKFGSVHRSCYKWDGKVDVDNMGVVFSHKIPFTRRVSDYSGLSIKGIISKCLRELFMVVYDVICLIEMVVYD